MTNDLMNLLISLCDDLAWGRPADEDKLYALTAEGRSDGDLARLAEAFGLMLVKLEARAMNQEKLIAELEKSNRDLAKARENLAGKNEVLARAVLETYNTRQLIGQCPALRRAGVLALSIARRPINTLILGPTGSGKEVVAKLIHYNSPRRDGNFLAVNCSTLPETLFESEMFGVEKGVATGVDQRKGLMEAASGGTLFLDELADLSLPNQVKLLRALQEGEVRRLGSSRSIKVDLLVISATSADMTLALAEKRFRSDLYYRLNVAEITLPPLAQRGDDILILGRHFLNQHAARLGRSPLELSPPVQAALMAHPWPGNVRELSNEMERLAALTIGQTVQLGDLSSRLTAPPPPPAEGNPAAAGAENAPPEPGSLDQAARQAVLAALARCNGNKTRAALCLGLSREGLRKKLKRLGLPG
ncbi:MAG: sigma-54 dependent transcriptional regulator [Candidatus Adiutrix sp.]|jgi:DNA-binding NtrC family response regulator|nr:sigma-54 dependent transcriptional regulator [Candidatus Adiutrix sp.]